MKNFFINYVWPSILGTLIGFVVAVGISATVGCKRPAAKLSDAALFESARTETLMMLNPNGTLSGGTGFEVQTPSGAVYTLTNAHVCAMTEGTYILARQNGRLRRLAIVDVSKTADLCILEGIPGRKGLPVSSAGLAAFTHIHIVGHPFLNPVTMTSGYVQGRANFVVSYCRSYEESWSGRYQILPFNPNAEKAPDCVKTVDAIITNAASAPGNSGSPVTNDNGEVVGVLFGGSWTGISLLVPLDQLRDYLSAF